ncbi:transglycosylase SLT domain-containing protein [Alicyclobacillus fodiniaquatilis]|uniref:Transglycosylase SLT domain-containing protein n=1 Tax=Alicyclobacillus fodiniaquatilis TaxID=1661150 RepID=A0ABW4JNA1_9BACL
MAFLSPNQVAQYAYEAGFRGHSLVTAVAVAGGESTFDPAATSPGDTSIGLWQINEIHDEADPSALLNPSFSAKMAYTISEHGTNWEPWRAYTNGSYKKYVSVAETAAQDVTPKAYPHLNVDVNGKAFPAISVQNSTYLLWTVLLKCGIPHKYLGNGKFSIDGQTVQGVVHEGNTYLDWGSIPDIKVVKVNGEFNFTDSFA